MCHKSAPKLQDFSELLTDIYTIRSPDLNIMDGVLLGLDYRIENGLWVKRKDRAYFKTLPSK